ncbi:hypothetical protein BT93_C0681 [Corymbia citriodora subsp. variegata]|nr:hypothetical protein BT93_C0681 [Corymbia citriodora subsp. variegata]
MVGDLADKSLQPYQPPMRQSLTQSLRVFTCILVRNVYKTKLRRQHSQPHDKPLAFKAPKLLFHLIWDLYLSPVTMPHRDHRQRGSSEENEGSRQSFIKIDMDEEYKQMFNIINLYDEV